MKRLVILWIVCGFAIALVVSWALFDGSPQPTTMQTRESSEGDALIAADFTLQGAGQKIVRGRDFRGRYLLIYFGFTHCPDVCPTTLLLMNNALSHLAATMDKVQPIFITVDPERDSPALTDRYAKNFGKNFIGLSGTPKQVQDAANGFKVYYSKVSQPRSALGYAVDHSSFIYLMGPDGKYLTHFASTDSEQEITEGLHRYVH